MTAIEDARVALTEMERIGTDGWCLCVSSSAQSKVESALRALIAEVERPTAPPTGGGLWTTERIREAFIYDGGEAEYYDPIDGAREQRRMMGAIFDAWLAAHDAEVCRQGPITDAQLRAARIAYASVYETGVTHKEALHAALEAARDTP